MRQSVDEFDIKLKTSANCDKPHINVGTLTLLERFSMIANDILFNIIEPKGFLPWFISQILLKAR